MQELLKAKAKAESHFLYGERTRQRHIAAQCAFFGSTGILGAMYLLPPRMVPGWAFPLLPLSLLAGSAGAGYLTWIKDDSAKHREVGLAYQTLVEDFPTITRKDFRDRYDELELHTTTYVPYSHYCAAKKNIESGKSKYF